MKTKIPALENLTIGLDLGDRRHHACVLAASGEILAEEVIVNTREVLTAFCARYPGATIVMETGTHSPWISRLVAALGPPGDRGQRPQGARDLAEPDQVRPGGRADAGPPGPRRSAAAQPGAPPQRGDAARARAAQGARGAGAQPRPLRSAVRAAHGPHLGFKPRLFSCNQA